MSASDGYINVVLEILRSLDTPKSHQALALIKRREWAELCNLEARPAHYNDARSYFLDAQAVALLRKHPKLDKKLAKNAKAEAFAKWTAAERQCYNTNLRFRDYCSGYYPEVNPRIISFLEVVRKNIRKVMGRVPRDLTQCCHGKGATFLDMGQNCTVLHKMQNRPTLTASTRDLLYPHFWETAWGRALVGRPESDPQNVRGNRYTTVPKNAKIERSIAVEPSINIWFQLGVGKHLRQRLKRYTQCDLDDGQQTHRALAREGSVSNAWATLDLSSASDTVASELVRFLVTDEWWTLLSSLRSPFTKTKSGWYLLEKFSSMGNGFTFELETLIFWATCAAVIGSSKEVFCYGDDIIVPTQHAQDVSMALRFMGFNINHEKSFTTGRFRESCGGDYFDGQDVRPYFLKETPNEPQQWMAFANGIRRISDRLSGHSDYLDRRLRRAYGLVLDELPRNIRRLKGPTHLGDAVLASDDPATWQLRYIGGVRHVKIYSSVGKFVPLQRFDGDVQLAAALYGVSSRGAQPRDSVKGYKEKWVPLSNNEGKPNPEWLTQYFRVDNSRGLSLHVALFGA